MYNNSFSTITLTSLSAGWQWPAFLIGSTTGCTASIVLSMTIFLTVGALTDNKGMKSFYYQAGLAERTEGFILFSFMILMPDLLWWTTGLFVIIELFTALQRFMEARKVLHVTK